MRLVLDEKTIKEISAIISKIFNKNITLFNEDYKVFFIIEKDNKEPYFTISKIGDTLIFYDDINFYNPIKFKLDTNLKNKKEYFKELEKIIKICIMENKLIK